MGHSLHILHDNCGILKTSYLPLFVFPGQNMELQMKKNKKQKLVSGTAFIANGVIALRKFPD